LSRQHQSDYDEETTARCERALVTLLGDIGPWSKRVYLAGGLAPRYIVGSLPEGARPHVGTTDVDLVIGLAVEDESDEAYRTLETNLKKAGFTAQNSFRWSKEVQGATIIVEFLCETDQVEAGRIFKPKQGSAPSTCVGHNSSPGTTSSAKLKQNDSMLVDGHGSLYVSPISSLTQSSRSLPFRTATKIRTPTTSCTAY
jgi:hypothetical protein